MGVAALLLLFAADGHPRWVCIAGCLRTRPLMSGFVASEKDKTISGARVVPHHALVQWWRPADRSVGGAADWSVGQSGGRTVGGRVLSKFHVLAGSQPTDFVPHHSLLYLVHCCFLFVDGSGVSP